MDGVAEETEAEELEDEVDALGEGRAEEREGVAEGEDTRAADSRAAVDCDDRVAGGEEGREGGGGCGGGEMEGDGAQEDGEEGRVGDSAVLPVAVVELGEQVPHGGPPRRAEGEAQAAHGEELPQRDVVGRQRVGLLQQVHCDGEWQRGCE